MTDGPSQNSATLTIELEPGLRRDVQRAAADRGLSLAEHVVVTLQQVVEAEAEEAESDPTAAWSRVSSAAFARDWASNEDRVYDDVS